MPSRTFVPGAKWKWARRLTQTFAFIAIFGAPFLGGWQRLDRADLATWDRGDAELPLIVREALPMKQAPRRAYEANQMMGGGVAVDYLSVPTIDPVAGALSLISSGASLRMLVALLLPLLLAVVAGRAFCGWFCPFGTLARGMRSVLNRIGWRQYSIPENRALRWVLLAVGLLASLFGVHLVVYLALPHLLLQQSVYSAWLLGGGSAVLGLLLGLLVAGLFLGPTTYCATLCPTGAVLGAVSGRRVVHLQIAAPSDCGTSCVRCDMGCWIQLDPASGDPGNDCDLCGRCTQACKRTNLQIGLGKGPLKVRADAALWMLVVTSLLMPQHAAAQFERKPEVVLAAETQQGGVIVAAEVIDMRGVKLGIDSLQRHTGVDVSVFIAKGTPAGPDEDGLLPSREIYEGPVTVRLVDKDADELATLVFEAPNSPMSAQGRSIYRKRVEVRLAAGDRITIDPVQGWFAEPVSWVIPPQGVDGSPATVIGFLGAAALTFMGLLSLALALGRRSHQHA